MQPLTKFIKDPSATLDYTLDWSAWLKGAASSDTISSVVWTAQAGINIENQSNTTTTTTVWLSGGALGKTYRVECLITTQGGRTEAQSFEVFIQSK
ncbi:MAG TPA: hypothetical protein VN736_01155 [Candidatus Limnocylindrales bacterium]|nr:hypothetical protein [Candidatus Limnocylindrales bacterium]